MLDAVEPGISTRELDDIGARILKEHDANSAPIVMYEFPGATCISFNNEAAHGIPGDRTVQPGDLINIDVSAEKNGYYADTARSMLVPPGSPLKQKLVACTWKALENGMDAARAGKPLNGIGRAVQKTARRCGFQVIRNLPGHGIGHSLHEEPQVLNFYHPKFRQPLKEGWVFTVEPFLSVGADMIDVAEDGWTLLTQDGSLAAQHEHTIVVTQGEPIILTAL